MPSSNAVVASSQTMQSITAIKLNELTKKRNAFLRKRKALDTFDEDDDELINSTQSFAQGVADLKLPTAVPNQVSNYLQFAKQARYDTSLTNKELTKYHRTLRSVIDKQSLRLDYATLYSAILKEHLDCIGQNLDQTPQSEATIEDGSLEGPFELLQENRLQQLREKFERVVFSPLDIDECKLTEYLTSLFSTDHQKKQLAGLRSHLYRDAEALFSKGNPFDDSTLVLTVKGLLQGVLLSEDKRAFLQSILDDVLLREEICDVLNMRWADLEGWTWVDDDSGINIEPRRQLNGKWRIVMDDDTLQSILLHYMGVTLGGNAREAMQHWLHQILVPQCEVTLTELCRRSFYLRQLNTDSSNGLQHKLNATYEEHFFLSHLPRSLQEGDGYENDTASSGTERKSWRELKQELLQHIATEAKIRYHVHGDVAVVQTDLQWFATSIPHGTIFTILEFLGLPEVFIEFFRKYLRTPLDMGKTSGEYRVRIRQRGMPMTHILENYLGELVLLFLDIAVRCEAGILLYRMHDDIFLYGSTEQCEKGWEALQKFVKITGLEINESKTGAVSIKKKATKTIPALPKGDVKFDFLKLNRDDASWIIDDELVNPHIKQLGKQLKECKSLLSFIRTYNSCIGRFFGYTFGLPAQCFGRKHTQAILATHKRMQEELFGSGGIAAVLTAKMQELIHNQNDVLHDMEILKSFIFMPLAFGGLGVANPFISLMLQEGNVIRSVDDRIREFFETEREAYSQAKQKFEKEHLSARKFRYKPILSNKNLSKTDFEIDLETFMSFEEYTQHREWLSADFSTLYHDLYARPPMNEPNLTGDVVTLLRSVRDDMPVKIYDLDRIEKRILALYADELVEKFGGLIIVDRGMVPIGVMKAILREKVTWQMVL